MSGSASLPLILWLAVSDSYADWRERLATANDPKFWPIEAIDAALDANDAQWWCDGENALVTRVVRYPGGAVVIEGIAAFGCLVGLWNNIQPRLVEWGKAIGATRLHALGRLGWGKKHPDDWKIHMVMICKDIEQ